MDEWEDGAMRYEVLVRKIRNNGCRARGMRVGRSLKWKGKENGQVVMTVA